MISEDKGNKVGKRGIKKRKITRERFEQRVT